MEDLPRFYQPEAQLGQAFSLTTEEARHAKVLRLQAADQVHVIDGKGSLYLANIQPIKRSFEINILQLELREEKPETQFVLAVAPTKNINRFEWVIEKAVEVGVREIIPIRCDNSERVHLKVERLDKIAVSAMKQSKALWKTEIHELTEFGQILSSNYPEKWIAHCQSGDKESIRKLTESDVSQLVCIGPEGDFSSNEISNASDFGFQSLSLGSQRLRTETAAIVVCIAANLFRP
ncbi:16S rRNA (uracil(1498)-N(3))-methyltransferase [Salibacteraceae bacterium]|nr:16S rRNA (uracil(1498)-N(3))-methyltransferase [Salibacteraceae bacterium]